MLKTSDGGLHWTRLKVAIGSPGLPGMLGPPLLFTDDEHGWSTWDQTSAPLLRVTSDGGSSWAEPSQVYDASMGSSPSTVCTPGMPQARRGGQAGRVASTKRATGAEAGCRSRRSITSRSPPSTSPTSTTAGSWRLGRAKPAPRASMRPPTAVGTGVGATPSASDQAWKLMGWQFCRAGDALLRGCQAAMSLGGAAVGAH